MNTPEQDSGQPAPDNRTALRRVMRGRRKAALASLARGAPYVSLVTIAFDYDLSPILLLSELADHTRNLRVDPRASLLLDDTDGLPNPQTGARVSAMGIARPCDDPAVKARFLARHPGATLYADFADFSVWRLQLERAHFVGGFGRAMWFPAPFGLDPAGVAVVAAAEADLLSRLNAECADSLSTIGGAAACRAFALDSDGMDLWCGDAYLRVDWPSRLADPQMIPAMLREIASTMVI